MTLSGVIANLLSITTPLVQPTIEYSSQFGSAGTGNGQFDYPAGIAVDPSGNIYVSDTGNNRVQKFDSSGNYLSQFGSFGYGGNGLFWMSSPGVGGIDFDSSGNIYVINGQPPPALIAKYDSDGNFISQFNVIADDLQDGMLAGIAVAPSGNIYVSQRTLGRIKVYDSSGNYLFKFDGGPGHYLSSPTSIALDSSGNVYVADFGNNVIEIFDSSGNYISQFGSPGEGDGQFMSPIGVDIDSSGNIYTFESSPVPRIQKFDSSGNYILQFSAGSRGSGDGEFYSTPGSGVLALDNNGNIYVADNLNNRIQKFTELSPTSQFNLLFTGSTTPSLSCLNVTISANISSEPFMCLNGCVDGGQNINWLFDIVSPSLLLDDLLQNPSGDNTPTFYGTSTDSANVASVEFQIDGTGGSWTNCSASDGNFNSITEAFVCSVSTLTDGEHTIFVRSTDDYNNTTPNINVVSSTFVIDTTSPTINIVSPQNNYYSTSTSINFNVSNSDAGLGFITPNLDSSLVSWWRMDDLDFFNNPNDYMGVNNGTFYGGANQAAGKFGKSFNFDGTGYIDTGFTIPATNFSVSFWQYPTANDGAYVNRSFGSADSRGGNYGLDYAPFAGGASVAVIRGGAGSDFACGGEPALYTWEFVTLIVSSTDGAKCYRNNILSGGDINATSMSVGGTTIKIGASGDDGARFKGKIDEFMIFNRVLTTDEITALYDGSSINHYSTLTEGEHTYKIFASDTAGNVSSSTLNTFTIDLNPPVISNISPVSGSTITATGQLITFNLNKFGDCRLSTFAKSYDDMSADTICSTSNGVQISCTAPTLAAGTQSLYFACQDYLGNKDSMLTAISASYVVPSGARRSRPYSDGGSVISTSTAEYNMLINNGANSTDNPLVNLTFSASPNSDAIVVVLSTNPDFYDASIVLFASSSEFNLCQGALSCIDNEYTVYARFINAYGIASPVVSAKINLNVTPLIIDIIDSAKDVVGNISSTTSEIITAILPKPKPTKEPIIYPPIETSVPEVGPYVFRGQWRVDLSLLLNNFVFESLPNDFKNTIQKFPDLTNILERVGINKMTDIGALTTTKIYLPGLSETLGLSGENISISELSKEQEGKIPTNIVFVRTADQKIDLNVKLSISNSGQTLKTINTIQGKPLSFIIKPEKPAKSIEGYIIFKSNDTGNVSMKRSSPKNSKGLEQTAAVFITGESVKIDQNTNNIPDLVLNKFEYKEGENGVWTADVISPQVLGQYELRTIVNFKEKKQSPERISMVVVVDPEGYVYEKLSDGREVRLKETQVSIYWENPNTKKYELWPAKDFRQVNPQVTDVTGRYSFLVPVGKYYLKAHLDSYPDYQSEPFQVEEGKGVFINIELKPTVNLFKIFNLQNILLALVGIFILLMYLAVFLSMRRSNNNVTGL